MAMALTSCAPSAGSTAQESDETGTGAAATGESAAPETEEQAADSGKPDLVIMGKEETDYNRAAQNKRVAETEIKVSALHAAAELPTISDKDYL